jgi:hypothetical protein
MLFRANFLQEKKVTSNVERDHRHISRIIAHCWNSMADDEKKEFYDKVEKERVLHRLRFPNYRFSPISRTTKPVKRNVKRNGIDELSRCRQVAKLLLEGKQGSELESAVQKIDTSVSDPVFRSPLLPPSHPASMDCPPALDEPVSASQSI